MPLKRHYFWIIYVTFVIGVLFTHGHSDMFSMQKPQPYGKVLIWLIFIAFSIFTIYCSMTEHFFKSLRKILGFRWGIQIGLDLSIGLILSLFVIYWHSGSALTTFLWLFPCVAVGNLATLLYFAVHYDALVGIFLN